MDEDVKTTADDAEETVVAGAEEVDHEGEDAAEHAKHAVDGADDDDVDDKDDEEEAA